MPSWCDRILYKINNIDKLAVLRYNSANHITSSDHFPVSAVFLLEMSNKLISISNSKVQQWDCYFEDISTWAAQIPFVCRFRLSSYFWKNISTYCDWIGIYPEFISAIDKPIQWVYLLTSYNDDLILTKTLPLEQGLTSNISQTLSLTKSSSHNSVDETASDIRLVVEFLELPKGRYRLGYYSKQFNCLRGMSKVFDVKDFF